MTTKTKRMFWAPDPRARRNLAIHTTDWLKENFLAAQPIRSTTKIWVVHVLSMDFLRSLLKRRFARAQVATSRNVGCFLRLLTFSLLELFLVI